MRSRRRLAANDRGSPRSSASGPHTSFRLRQVGDVPGSVPRRGPDALPQDRLAPPRPRRGHLTLARADQRSSPEEFRGCLFPVFRKSRPCLDMLERSAAAGVQRSPGRRRPSDYEPDGPVRGRRMEWWSQRILDRSCARKRGRRTGWTDNTATLHDGRSREHWEATP